MEQPWTVLRVLRWTTGYLQEKGIEAARHDAERLLCAALERDRVGLYLTYDQPLHADELQKVRALVKRRAAREPLQYILGETEFWSLPFRVTPAVLIPRPDTEVLVEEALRLLAQQAGPVLDVGTGSGAIAVAIAADSPGRAVAVTALDISETALAVARANAERNGVAQQIDFQRGDLDQLDSLVAATGPWQLVVSNPPYVTTQEMSRLMPEVADHEPHLALHGGEDGLDPYRSLARQAASLLLPGGWLLVEVGATQAEAVAVLFRAAGLQQDFVRHDYGGLPRVVGAQRPVAG